MTEKSYIPMYKWLIRIAMFPDENPGPGETATPPEVTVMHITAPSLADALQIVKFRKPGWDIMDAMCYKPLEAWELGTIDYTIEYDNFIESKGDIDD